LIKVLQEAPIETLINNPSGDYFNVKFTRDEVIKAIITYENLLHDKHYNSQNKTMLYDIAIYSVILDRLL